MRVDVEDPIRKGKAMTKYNEEQTTDMKKILEERVLDSHMTLSLRELLGITKEFHDTIIDLVKRKRPQSDEEEESPLKAKTNAIMMARDEVDEDMVDNQLYLTSLDTSDNGDAGQDGGEERDRGSLDRPWFGDQPYVDRSL